MKPELIPGINLCNLDGLTPPDEEHLTAETVDRELSVFLSEVEKLNGKIIQILSFEVNESDDFYKGGIKKTIYRAIVEIPDMSPRYSRD